MLSINEKGQEVLKRYYFAIFSVFRPEWAFWALFYALLMPELILIPKFASVVRAIWKTYSYEKDYTNIILGDILFGEPLGTTD